MITGSQLRAARALLDWTQDELATNAGVASRTIRLLESGSRKPYDRTLGQLQGTLEAAGIQFLESDAGVGVMLIDTPADLVGSPGGSSGPL